MNRPTAGRSTGETSRADAVAAGVLARSSALWVVAVLFYGIGDTATTLAGYGTPRVTEAGPVVAGLVGHAGLAGLVAVKLASFAGFYAAWRLLPPPGRAGIPLALAVVGVLVTAWNLLVLLPPGLLR